MANFGTSVGELNNVAANPNALNADTIQQQLETIATLRSSIREARLQVEPEYNRQLQWINKVFEYQQVHKDAPAEFKPTEQYYSPTKATVLFQEMTKQQVATDDQSIAKLGLACVNTASCNHDRLRCEPTSTPSTEGNTCVLKDGST